MNAKTHKHGYVLWCAAILIAMPVCGRATTKDMKDVDLDALIRETQRLSPTADTLTLLWWIPEEFWSVCLAQDPGAVSTSETQAFLDAIHEYAIFIVVDSSRDASGGTTFRSERAIRNDMRLVDPQGRTYAPLGAAQIDADMRNLLQFIKTDLASFGGPFGQNTQILVFPCETETGARIVEARGRGELKVLLGNREFLWQLPLDSLLVSKYCHECEEQRKGSWNFCPWCGGKLTEP